MKQYGAEFLGTFWLVLGGCGSAVLAAAFPEVGIGLHGVSLAFGLTVLTMAFAIGHISGCHLNPAVSIGLWAGGRFQASELIPYIIAQVLGGIAAGGVLYVIASGAPGFDVASSVGDGDLTVHNVTKISKTPTEPLLVRVEHATEHQFTADVEKFDVHARSLARVAGGASLDFRRRLVSKTS